MQRQPVVRPIPLLVLLTVGGVLVASSIPILFTPEQPSKSRPEQVARAEVFASIQG
ncbi:hypothetical protein [Synechococcus sp. KORDI-52]|uniref:hypothetical protein n=1 Tax=Synechococcus sp. KORDI-52 TaxID=585425 RepID=UPI001C1E36D4|nr:hypothetical protein [Synechococcus sp. KORDI-52]